MAVKLRLKRMGSKAKPLWLQIVEVQEMVNF